MPKEMPMGHELSVSDPNARRGSKIHAISYVWLEFAACRALVSSTEPMPIARSRNLQTTSQSSLTCMLPRIRPHESNSPSTKANKLCILAMQVKNSCQASAFVARKCFFCLSLCCQADPSCESQIDLPDAQASGPIEWGQNLQG